MKKAAFFRDGINILRSGNMLMREFILHTTGHPALNRSHAGYYMGKQVWFHREMMYFHYQEAV
jgi:hypothetical protein